MVLPSGVNKATGLGAALAELGLSPHNVVAVGDAENDHALLQSCECGAAVANALPALKARADLVLERDHGAGVRELIDRLLEDDLRQLGPSLVPPPPGARRGRGRSGHAGSLRGQRPHLRHVGERQVHDHDGLIERLCKHGYQYAIVDPEGDYPAPERGVVLGAPTRAPLVAEILDVLKQPSDSVSANLLGIAVNDRPAFFRAAPARAVRSPDAERPAALARDRRGPPHAAGRLGAGRGAAAAAARHALHHGAPRAGGAVGARGDQHADRDRRGAGAHGPRAVPAARAARAVDDPRRSAAAGGAGAVLARRRARGDRRPGRADQDRAHAPLAQVHGGQPRPRSGVLLPRPRRQAQPEGAQPADVPDHGRRRRRRHLALPPPGRRLLGVAAWRGEGWRPRRRGRADRAGRRG